MHSTIKVSFLLAIFGMALGATVVKPELANTDPFPHYEPDEIFTCGGVITEETEQILYKPFRQVEANERCVWIVSVHEASSYRVRLHHSGFEPTSGLLNVAGVNLGSTALRNVASLSSSWTSLSSSQALVITFHTSNETSSTGFALEYEVGRRDGAISPNSKHSLVDADTLFVKYPEGRANYDNYELAIFALPPLNNVHVEGHSRQVIYNRLGLERNCYDKVSIYNFNTATNRYDLQGSLCDTTNVELIKSSDTSLLVFRSDVSNVGAGFNLVFTSCSA